MAADLVLLEESVREAGKIARSFFGGTYKRWDKGKGNPVTEADLAVDKFLGEHLRAARPGYGWLSEETEDDAARLTAPAVFVVDPIDGTVAFMKNKPHFTICAGVVIDGAPVAGAVYNPITDECFTAHAGGGASLNGSPIVVSARAMPMTPTVTPTARPNSSISWEWCAVWISTSAIAFAPSPARGRGILRNRHVPRTAAAGQERCGRPNSSAIDYRVIVRVEPARRGTGSRDRSGRKLRPIVNGPRADYRAAPALPKPDIGALTLAVLK